MPSGDIFGIGTSALLTYQRMLATTSHNIANVQNENYSRQRVELEANIPQLSGGGYVGTGVQSTTTARQYDSFLTTVLRDNISSQSKLDTYYGYATQVDNLVADPDAGLTPAIEDFFNAAHDVANDPTSIATRSVMLSSAETLADRFHYMDARIQELSGHVDEELDTTISDINALATSIASLNKDITYARGRGNGVNEPNDLLDQRDAAVAELSKLVKVSTYEESNGALSVFIGNGQSLVVGSTAQTLTLTGNAYDYSYLEVAYQGNTTNPITQFMTGGQLGGLLAVRDEILNPVRDEMGRIAVALSETFNDQHQQGMDLNGNMGQSFFTDLADSSQTGVLGPQFLPNLLTNDAATDVQGSIAFTDVSALQASDYRLSYDGANYTLTRLSDKTVVGTVAAAGFPQTLSFASEGLDIALTGTSITAGDSFLLRPTRNAAADIGVTLAAASEIAAAAPFRIDDQTDANGMPTNTGTGVVSPGTMSNAEADAAYNRLSDVLGSNELTLSFESLTPNHFEVTTTGALPAGFDILDSNGNTVLVGGSEFVYDPATDSGTEYTLVLPGFGNISFTVSGTPNSVTRGAAADDQFVIRDNAFDNSGTVVKGGIGDARNAAQLAGLQTRKTMLTEGGTTDYQGVYATMVADVGIRTQQAEINMNAQDTLLQKSREERDAVSAVNLDEEAANLIRYQQAYQAAAQVFSAARQMFQTLLNVAGG